jgi:hypothetical protein
MTRPPLVSTLASSLMYYQSNSPQSLKGVRRLRAQRLFYKWTSLTCRSARALLKSLSRPVAARQPVVAWYNANAVRHS